MHVFGHHDESKQPVLMPDYSTPAGFAEKPTMEIVVYEGQSPVAGESQFVDVPQLVIVPHLFSMGPSHAVQGITAEPAEPVRDVRFKGHRTPSDFALPDKPDSGTPREVRSKPKKGTTDQPGFGGSASCHADTEDMTRTKRCVTLHFTHPTALKDNLAIRLLQNAHQDMVESA